ncbi:protein C1orf43 homolog isoform X2 [Dreissena polymorpha]|uniref:protein C1orf43 homolog isoform X2 n=1 Tax=Dreissena polymorpha TaxID=45954 RepID=UPI002263ECDC|nr:protein C1orf43 homolog isoform X2 [Dreissena polymorpha]XP_052278968.1 protein C1orf43 homolog isoform X2 [Dreissena polymorpha]
MLSVRCSTKMVDVLSKLSVVSVIWIIAAGFLIFLLLFLFAKRQIMRFTLKSRRGPYVSIGSNVPKELRTEIFRRINRVPDIKHEPKLVNPAIEALAKSGDNNFYYRMKAMDAFSRFDDCLRLEMSNACRHPSQSVRDYLTLIYPMYLTTAPSHLVNNFINMYEHARHRPEMFGEDQFNQYESALNEIVNHLERGIHLRKEEGREDASAFPLADTDVKIKSRGMGKSKTSIPYNHMVSDKSMSRGQTRYRTRANSSEQAGLLESAPSSQRSSIEGLVTARDSSEENIRLVEVNMNTMPEL